MFCCSEYFKKLEGSIMAKTYQPIEDRYSFNKEVNPVIMRSDVMYLLNEVYRLQKYEHQLQSISEAYYKQFSNDTEEDNERYSTEFEDVLTRVLDYDKDQ
jgi:predicted hydrolase (HD superfamily)